MSKQDKHQLEIAMSTAGQNVQKTEGTRLPLSRRQTTHVCT